ncbi:MULTISPECIES: sigma-54-dependent transcriptional regulator [Herbaspirillum]|jgi:DNA-binding NtrC family response regulator|nr:MULTISPECIES: sigma-54 dependent transcriptional regulator [Herbaspirillum]MCP3658659.1 sigma-54-dependent Fis family transcriptional regulator [Herbaspirillum sp.]MCP3948903.1 sigma-54-dependent Fis family transcriptional regulator [Herbaspirillum sp.]MCP4030150.1 sigma-54-dependent Fis family transcriptional regulator [Herbaspirillum sp.]MCP4555454.1 sigma-54-dependent Fis family transcriptional regulator [Herbaspirillum sp.]MEE1636876.1 sigma-54 dependent transcriptional regulator [Herba
MARILIVDDDAAFRGSLAETVGDLGHEVLEAGSTAAGLTLLAAHAVDAAIVDLRMPEEDGLVFLQRAPAIAAIPCIMLTAYASGDNTIEAIRLGAFDHLTKPVPRAALVETLERALRQSPAATEDASAMQSATGDERNALVGDSEAMRQVFKQIGRAATSDATVLILGETGTGKELVARALHRNGLRAARPFVAINCAAIPAELIESELFGHVKGAFSGATAARLGRFQEAHGGTLFLDEIGDMALPTQAKILRVLQERELTPVGGQQAVKVDVRVIAATHRDLPQEISEGRFREDLWYRLQVLPIKVPPLRERPGDILAIAEHFLRQQGGDAPKRISPAAARRLLQHAWPGNVRELRNTMERAAVMSHGACIEPEDIALADRSVTENTSDVAIDWDGELAVAIAQVERVMLQRALAAANGNRAEAARRLGISRQQLYRKLEEQGGAVA